MKPSHLRWILFLLSCTIWVLGQDTATVKGRVTTTAGPAPGVLVTVSDTTGSYMEFVLTGENGEFFLSKIPAGTYGLEFSGTGLETHVESDVVLAAGQTMNFDIFMKAPVNIMEILTVTTASRRPERLLEAPASVSIISENEMALQTAHGQLPRLLEFEPGVEINQNGVWDFNLNARGFNSSLNRRILVLIDGRNPYVTLLGNQEWSTLSLPLEAFSSLEMVRGPGSALYGANAYNGVLNLKTKRPADDPGGTVTLAGGELNSYRADVTYAAAFGSGWALRVNGGTFSSETWSEPRTEPPFEYGPLPDAEGPDIPEAFPLDEDDITAVFFGLRLDKEFANGHLLTAEYGTSNSENGLAMTGIGRVQITEVERPWFRIAYSAPHLDIHLSRSDRDTPQGQPALSSGILLYEDSYNQHAELKTDWSWLDQKINFVGGVTYHTEDVDTRNPQGIHTTLGQTREEDQQAAYAQFTFKLGGHLDLVLAGRYDDSTLHDAQTSPKGGLVWKVNDDHVLRATYNRAFQTPTYSEYFLRAPSDIVPFDMIEAGIEAAVGMDLPLNWQAVPAMGLGNENLEVEEIETIEVGYKGIIGSSMFLTLDYYQSNLTNFVSELLPGVNPDLPEFTLPDTLPAELQTVIWGVLQSSLGAAFPGLSVNLDPTNPFVPLGHPMVTASYTNAGEVDMEGVEFSFNYFINPKWSIFGNYSWFDYDVVSAELSEDLIPNAPDSKYAFGLVFDGDKALFRLRYKHSDDFLWAAGIFRGMVPAYDVVNLNAAYDFTDSIRLALNVSNLLDDEHFENYGGSVNGRRALCSVHFRF